MECALCAADLPRDIGNWVLDGRLVCHECAHRDAERARYQVSELQEPAVDVAASSVNACRDCGVTDESEQLAIVAADLGEGAFLAILCKTCLHRREYRHELRRRKQLRLWLADRSKSE